jgi:hypothetical protein
MAAIPAGTVPPAVRSQFRSGGRSAAGDISRDAARGIRRGAFIEQARKAVGSWIISFVKDDVEGGIVCVERVDVYGADRGEYLGVKAVQRPIHSGVRRGIVDSLGAVRLEVRKLRGQFRRHDRRFDDSKSGKRSVGHGQKQFRAGGSNVHGLVVVFERGRTEGIQPGCLIKSEGAKCVRLQPGRCIDSSEFFSRHRRPVIALGDPRFGRCPAPSGNENQERRQSVEPRSHGTPASTTSHDALPVGRE